MKAYEIGTQNGLDSLRQGDHPDAVAGPGEAVLRVAAVCLNHRDLLGLAGSMARAGPEERVPVSDGVGEVIAVGDGVTSVRIGDRATAPHFASRLGGAFAMSCFGRDLDITHDDGWLAERTVIPARRDHFVER